MRKIKLNHNRGITLIALIITVIVLLILAGTAISISVNGGDLFGKAQNAVSGYNAKVAEEETKINEVWDILNSINGGGTGNPTATPEPLPAEWGTTASTYVASAYPSSTAPQKAPIPKGFKVSIYNDSIANETTIAGGLVIYKTTTDLVADEGSSTANHEATMRNYDQYVWIPVDNSDTIQWSDETADKTVLDDGTGTKVIETSEPTTLTTDFNAMKASVQNYGGFYISRYELGGSIGNPTSRKGQVVANAGTDSSTGGVNQWYGLYNLAHQIKAEDGATALTSVGAHMIFGSEYSKVLAFIDSNNASYSTTPHENKQQTAPHESGVVLPAQVENGKVLDEINNIIDLEGNLFEWTAKAYSTNGRVRRGGVYYLAEGGDFYPASYSVYNNPTSTYSYGCTRQTLYVTL